MHTILRFPHSPPTVRAELSVQAGEKLIFSANTLLLCKHTVIPTIGRRASCQFRPDSGLILTVNNDWRAGRLSYYPQLLRLKFAKIRRHHIHFICWNSLACWFASAAWLAHLNLAQAVETKGETTCLAQWRRNSVCLLKPPKLVQCDPAAPGGDVEFRHHSVMELYFTRPLCENNEADQRVQFTVVP